MAFDKIKVSKQRMDFFERSGLSVADVLLSDDTQYDFATHEAAYVAALRHNSPMDIFSFIQNIRKKRNLVAPNHALEKLALSAIYTAIKRCDDRNGFVMAQWLFDVTEDDDTEIAQKAFDASVAKMVSAAEQKDDAALNMAAWLSEQSDFCTDKSRKAVAWTVERTFPTYARSTYKLACVDNDFDGVEEPISFYEILLEEAVELFHQHENNAKVRKYALDAIGRSLVKFAAEGELKSDTILQFLEMGAENSGHEVKALEALQLLFTRDDDKSREDFDAFCRSVETGDHPKKDKLIEVMGKIKLAKAQDVARRTFDF